MIDIGAGNIITLVSVLVSIGIGWGVVQQQLKEHTKRIDHQEERVRQVDDCLRSVEKHIAEIARDILYIRKQLDKEDR